jgi:hypothetical protein
MSNRFATSDGVAIDWYRWGCRTLAGGRLTVMRSPALAEAAVRFFNS